MKRLSLMNAIRAALAAGINATAASINTLLVDTVNGQTLEGGTLAPGVDSGAGALTVNVVAVAKTYTRTTGSWLTDGFSAGMVVNCTGFTNSGNNGLHTIATVNATVMTMTSATGLVNETGSGNERVAAATDITYATVSGVSVAYGDVDPAAGLGVALDVPAIYWNTVTGRSSTKSGAGATAWKTQATVADDLGGLRFRKIAESTWVAASPTVTDFGPYTLNPGEYPMVHYFRTDAVANGGYGDGPPATLFYADDSSTHFKTTTNANEFYVSVGHIVAGNANANFRFIILGVSAP